MKLLYISNLTGNLFAGPNYSVPAQIASQSKYDDVFWYNINQVKRKEWSENGLDCKNLSDYPTGRLADLPEPFNTPDLAIIEELYCYPFCRIIADLQKKGVPYIIVPRSTMTVQAQNKNHLKKIIGNLLWFNKMIKKAVAVQYLTKEEQLESAKWKVESFVVPNGIYPQEERKTAFSEDKIKATYIGRFETYQKGLDLLFSAIAKEQNALREVGFSLSLYGPNQESSLEGLQNQAKEQGIEDLLTINDSVFKDEKKKVLLSTDVFIMTSRFEGLPMGMIEALAYGLPCIATVGTNLSDEIVRYDAGWTATNDVESICDALRTMIKDRDKLLQKSQNAVKMANEYSWDTIAKKSHKIYGKIIGK